MKSPMIVLASLLVVLAFSANAAAQELTEDSQASAPQVTLPEITTEGARLIPADSFKDTGSVIEDISAHRVQPLSYVRKLRDYVDVDLGPIDLEADVVMKVDGKPITRNEYRKRAIMYAGLNEVERRITQIVTLQEIDRRVAEHGGSRDDYLPTDADVDARFQEQMEMVGITAADPNSPVQEQLGDADDPVAEAKRMFIESIETSIGMDGYRDMLRADAAFERVFLPIPAEATGEEVHDLANGPVPEDDPKPEWMPQITWDALSRDEQAITLRNFVKAGAAKGEPIPPFFKSNIGQKVREGVIALTGLAYFFDEDLPENAFMRVGDQLVTVDELWPMVLPSISDVDEELAIRETLTLKAMQSVLRKAGRWLDDEEFDEIFAEHEAVYEGSLFPLSAIIIFRGYSSVARYREHYRYREAYARWRKASLSDSEIEEHYRTGARLFFERGSIDVDLAYNGIGGETFEGASFAAAAEELAAAFDEAGGDLAAIKERFELPIVRSPSGNDRNFQRNPLRMRMTESDLSIFLTGYSLADDMFYHGQPGDVYGPWPQRCRRHAWGAELNAGVWMGKVNNYNRQRALAPFQGRDREQATEDYLDLNYLFWSQECLKEMLNRVEPTLRS